MVYCFCYCVSLHVCPGDFFFLFRIAVWPFLRGKKLSFWLSVFNVLIVVSLL